MRSWIGGLKIIGGVARQDRTTAGEAASVDAQVTPGTVPSIGVRERSAEAGDSGRPVSAPAAREPDPGPYPGPHARRLLAWLQADDGLVGEVLAADIQAAYREMCSEIGWRALTWLRVGEELSLLTGPRGYRYVRRDGRRHRLRFYRIQPAGVAPPVQRPGRMTLGQRVAALEATIAQMSMAGGGFDRDGVAA